MHVKWNEIASHKLKILLIALGQVPFAIALYLPCLLHNFAPVHDRVETPGWLCFAGSILPWLRLFSEPLSMKPDLFFRTVCLYACYLTYLPCNICVIGWPIALHHAFRWLGWPIRIVLMLGFVTSLQIVFRVIPEPTDHTRVLIGYYFWVGSIAISAIVSKIVLRVPSGGER